MCCYREKRAEPTDIMPLEGFTVDYCDPTAGLHYMYMYMYSDN